MFLMKVVQYLAWTKTLWLAVFVIESALSPYGITDAPFTALSKAQ